MTPEVNPQKNPQGISPSTSTEPTAVGNRTFTDSAQERKHKLKNSLLTDQTTQSTPTAQQPVIRTALCEFNQKTISNKLNSC